MGDRTTLRRKPDRSIDDRQAIHALIDEAVYCHVGIVAGGATDAHPVVIPMLHARQGERLLLHGSPASRLLRTARDGVDLCATITLSDALVLARSGFHHSMNYRSVVVLGRATEVIDHDEKVEALDRFVEHAVPGRTARIRPATTQEVKGTLVLSVPLDDCSMKVRSGPPIDDEADMDSDTWAGLIPLHQGVGTPIPDEATGDATVPGHVAFWSRGPGQLNGRPADQERTV